MTVGEESLRREICEIGRRMYDRRMVAANDGNISVRLSDNEFLCTPTGVSKGYMTPEMLCLIDSTGKLIEDRRTSDFRPSSEVKMHLKVYENCPQVNAVVHAHPAFATTFAVARIPLDRPLTAEAVVSLGTIPVAEYATPSTKEVPESIVPFLKDYEAVLLANHGALTWGRNLLDTYHLMESVEFYAEMTYRVLSIGGGVELSPEEVDKLKEVRRKVWGKS